jgi:hypothetical protein
MKHISVFLFGLVVAASLLLTPRIPAHEWMSPVPVHAQGQGCDYSVVISVSSGTSAILIPRETSASPSICGFLISGDTLATTAQFKIGTGTTCGTGTVNLTGAIRLADEMPVAYGGAGAVIINSGAYDKDLCITTATGAVTGVLTYRK